MLELKKLPLHIAVHQLRMQAAMKYVGKSAPKRVQGEAAELKKLEYLQIMDGVFRLPAKWPRV